MFEYLERLRKKKAKTRNIIAASVAFVVSFSLFLVWLTVFMPDFEKRQKEVEILTQAKSPTTNFVEVVSNSFMEMKDKVDGLRGVIKDLTASTTYYTASSTIQMHEEISSSSSTEKME